jgi:hypothetical protein
MAIGDKVVAVFLAVVVLIASSYSQSAGRKRSKSLIN